MIHSLPYTGGLATPYKQLVWSQSSVPKMTIIFIYTLYDIIQTQE